MRQRNHTRPKDDVAATNDIVHQLRAEHAWLQELAQCAADAQDAQRRVELGQALRFHWDAHADAEERCVYWMLAGHVQTAEWVHNSRVDHARIDRYVSALLHEDPHSSAWVRSAQDLVQALADHTHTEEMGILSRIPAILRKDEVRELGEMYNRLRTRGALGSSTPAAS